MNTKFRVPRRDAAAMRKSAEDRVPSASYSEILEGPKREGMLLQHNRPGEDLPTREEGDPQTIRAKVPLAALLLVAVFVAACGSGGGAPSHYVDLQWDPSPSPGVIGYNVYRGTISGGPYTKLNSSFITELTYTDEDVQAGQTYYYVATAIASDGVTESPYSNEASAFVPSP